MERTALAAGFAGLLCLLPPPARALIERVEFSGVVTSVADQGGVPIPRWSFVVENETPFSGWYVYDDAQTDIEPDPTIGRYPYAGGPFWFQVDLGPYVFASDAFAIQVIDDNFFPTHGIDGQAAQGMDVIGAGDPMAPVVKSLVVIWGSDSGDAIASDQVIVPGDQLMQVFPDRAQLLISICSQPEPACQPMIELVGRIDTVAAPEPASGAASAAALAALGLAGAVRRRGAGGARPS